MQSLNSRLSAIHLLCWVTAPLTRMFPQSRQVGGQGTVTEKQTNKYELDIQKCNIFQNRQADPWDSDKKTNKYELDLFWIQRREYIWYFWHQLHLSQRKPGSAHWLELFSTFYCHNREKKSLEPPEGGLWQSTCTCFLSFDGFFLLKCPTSVCKACIEAKQKEARWYLRARLLSFFWAPFLKLKSRTFEERISSENFHVLCAFHSRLPLFRESIGKWGSKLSYASVARSINLYGRFPLKAFNVDWMTHWLGQAITVIKR